MTLSPLLRCIQRSTSELEAVAQESRTGSNLIRHGTAKPFRPGRIRAQRPPSKTCYPQVTGSGGPEPAVY